MDYIIAFDKTDNNYKEVDDKIKEVSDLNNSIQKLSNSVYKFVTDMAIEELIDEFKEIFVNGDNAHLISINLDGNDLMLRIDIIIESRESEELDTLRETQYIMFYDITEDNYEGRTEVRTKLVNDFHAIMLSQSAYQFNSDLDYINIMQSFEPHQSVGDEIYLIYVASANHVRELQYHTI